MSRSRPISRRRDATAKANVLAMTKIVMNPLIVPTMLRTTCNPEVSAAEVGTRTCVGAVSLPPSVVTVMLSASGPR
ncbi:hypothetical protein [Kribbella pittospori]|uniref:hypothetical protein n=1 Tax=Kribbella pittospori TaxID=722689 RepID=UPI001EDDFEB5|nr:hypothetical protein [Kribbella pittospori]